MRARTLELKVPPPVVAVIVAALMWGVSRTTPSLRIEALTRSAIALLVAAIGVGFTISGFVAFRRAKTTIDPTTPQAASSLVSSGVYRITRNPMYVGLLLILIGWAVFLSSGWALLGAPIFAAYIQRFQITPEERALAALFGTEYVAYKARVHRWV